MEPIAEVGPLVFRLKDMRVERFSPVRSEPVLLLDGTQVERFEREGGLFLLIDHRSQPAELPAHVEFWECLVAGEADVAGLYAVCDLAPVGLGLRHPPEPEIAEI